ncbi:hypothetical protein Alches_00970 [Alicyclobacillus hesperidum subsp. aegles]|uniref:hypothetical protein n=1 Tax=Alicyclobacillus hesperidum TaxID=89784 RepID=UPI0007190AFC|nr:hypothetical protein [Alicyclobacillus hesperidum]KRW92529.1 hypothetical protein SD51_03385 [Alicyclobacillus tengchongensis]GLG00058.1 hypothetical protein Alches_00970 [Alicyclobacillus hesperidum subsp. aegles]
MKFTLYGEGQGLSVDLDRPFVTVTQNRVADVSISAKKAGVQIGCSVAQAKALIPGVHVVGSVGESRALTSVYQVLWDASPFVRTLPQQFAFFVQLPSGHPPLTEVRSICRRFDDVLSCEQRVRVGLAEHPFAAEALVCWSRIERVPNALYYRVGRQQLLISPAIARMLEGSEPIFDWTRGLPIAVVSAIPEPCRNELIHLGVHRLQDLDEITDEMLVSRFGTEALSWRRIGKRIRYGLIVADAPPGEHLAIWRSPLGEPMPESGWDSVLELLAAQLCQRVVRSDSGIRRIALRWQTNAGSGEWIKTFKRPVYQAHTVVVQLQGWRDHALGCWLEEMELEAVDVQLLPTVQSGFLLFGEGDEPVRVVAKTKLQSVREQLVHKFPKIQIGLVPDFRELRLAAVLRGMPG